MNASADTRTLRQRGFALLIVLWTVGLLALLGTQLVAAGRGDAQLARNLLDSAVLEAAANGAVQQAIFAMLLPPPQRWAADGSLHVLRLGTAVITVRLEDEGGKINPNLASAALLDSLLIQVGAPAATAASLAAAIVAWRSGSTQSGPLGATARQYAAAGLNYGPPETPFRHLDELGLVLGMTPESLARLRPHMTVYSDDDPDGSTYDPVVAAALGNPAPPSAAYAPAAYAASVIVEARGPGHGVFNERVVVRLEAQPGRRPYSMLSWEQTLPGVAETFGRQ